MYRSNSPPMSVLISSSPPLPSLFLDLYQDGSSHTSNRDQKSKAQNRAFPDGPFRPKLSSTSSSSSLSSTSSCEITRAKKGVTFADTVGLPLTQVKVVRPEEKDWLEPPPRLKTSAYPPATSPSVILKPGLKLNFSQPIRRLNYLETVRVNHIGLESVLLDGFTLTGHILVQNLAFEKTVRVRYTTDYWLSHSEHAATFSRSIAPDLDQFQFVLKLATSLPPGARVELCVVTEQGGTEFWDNNGGENYLIECAMLPISAGFIMSDGLIAGRHSATEAAKPPATPKHIYY